MIKISGKSGGAAVYTNLVSLEKLAALGVTAAVIGVMATIVRPERSSAFTSLQRRECPK